MAYMVPKSADDDCVIQSDHWKQHTYMAKSLIATHKVHLLEWRLCECSIVHIVFDYCTALLSLRASKYTRSRLWQFRSSANTGCSIKWSIAKGLVWLGYGMVFMDMAVIGEPWQHQAAPLRHLSMPAGLLHHFMTHVMHHAQHFLLFYNPSAGVPLCMPGIGGSYQQQSQSSYHQSQAYLWCHQHSSDRLMASFIGHSHTRAFISAVIYGCITSGGHNNALPRFGAIKVYSSFNAFIAKYRFIASPFIGMHTFGSTVQELSILTSFPVNEHGQITDGMGLRFRFEASAFTVEDMQSQNQQGFVPGYTITTPKMVLYYVLFWGTMSQDQCLFHLDGVCRSTSMGSLGLRWTTASSLNL
ncbi:hypothetical protein O0I10_012652 [Lichtheimia ornata]|uniref:Uncharacterized protein n=1 Tax=Lichtheimia ornata TaxID=688661 RepID=A0AAD7URB6_9FUNG|nr:uncharacterized protein O0I10_012652 [Lichtheimia ornata]KAJ8651775.1 hypothetical protein O0I10_012652 [Lichtheimia ornata]